MSEFNSTPQGPSNPSDEEYERFLYGIDQDATFEEEVGMSREDFELAAEFQLLMCGYQSLDEETSSRSYYSQRVAEIRKQLPRSDNEPPHIFEMTVNAQASLQVDERRKLEHDTIQHSKDLAIRLRKAQQAGRFDPSEAIHEKRRLFAYFLVVSELSPNEPLVRFLDTFVPGELIDEMSEAMDAYYEAAWLVRGALASQNEADDR